MRLAKKALLVTGGNGGIGLAAAKLFVAEGARVAITGRNESTLNEAAASLGVVAVRADVTDYPAMQRALAQAVEQVGKLDGVFVNAGVSGQTPLGHTTVEDFEAIVRANFTGAFFTAQAALPHLKDGASLVFNGSVIASLGMPGYSAYGGSKGAVLSMVRSLASELAPRRIRVNQVTPGATRTPIWSTAVDAVGKRISATTPLGRMGEPDEIARAALYLLSDDSAYVTATELVVDGGATGAPAGAPAFRPR
jgi:NAD(P)-dependent dehydrogenase (short-subunit alcohol dehydrogenase family)